MLNSLNLLPRQKVIQRLPKRITLRRMTKLHLLTRPLQPPLRLTTPRHRHPRTARPLNFRRRIDISSRSQVRRVRCRIVRPRPRRPCVQNKLGEGRVVGVTLR